MKTIPLPAVPRELQKLTDGPVPTYRRLYLAILDGSVKAEQQSNGRYRVDADLTPVLQHFGLKA